MTTTTIFDLDHTLLDSMKLKEDLAEVLGMSIENYNKSYKEFFEDNGVSYSFKEHLKNLEESNLYDWVSDMKTAERRFSNKFKEMEYLLNDGSLDLVASEKKKGHKTILVTFGNKQWQEEKIVKSGLLNESFEKNEIFCIDEDKGDFVAELSKEGEKYIIINDNIEESIKMVARLGKENCEVKIIGSKYHEEEKLKAKELAIKSGFEFYESISDLLKIDNEYSEEIKDIFPRENLFGEGQK